MERPLSDERFGDPRSATVGDGGSQQSLTTPGAFRIAARRRGFPVRAVIDHAAGDRFGFWASRCRVRVERRRRSSSTDGGMTNTEQRLRAENPFQVDAAWTLTSTSNTITSFRPDTPTAAQRAVARCRHRPSHSTNSPAAARALKSSCEEIVLRRSARPARGAARGRNGEPSCG